MSSDSNVSLLFLTGNAGKLREVRAAMPSIEAWDIDLPEIQSADGRQIIEAKLLEAARHKPDQALLVEDTSLYLDALGGLPGPLVKWFITKESLGLAGLAELAAARQNDKAHATTWLGLLLPGATEPQLHFFEGTVTGKIVSPRGDQGFGWDPIFVPDGSAHSFAEMDAEEKAHYSMRSLALAQLTRFLAAR